MSEELENRLESWEQLAREAVAEFEDARGYASSYFSRKWGYDETSRRFAETIESLASLRARPQEPGLSKEWLDEVIARLKGQIVSDLWDEETKYLVSTTLYLLRDEILSAPSGPLSDEPRELEWRRRPPADYGEWYVSGRWDIYKDDGEEGFRLHIEGVSEMPDDSAIVARGLTVPAAKSLAASLQSVLDGCPL